MQTMSYASFTTAVARFAESHGRAITIGASTHDAWRAGKSPEEVALAMPAKGPDAAATARLKRLTDDMAIVEQARVADMDEIRAMLTWCEQKQQAAREEREALPKNRAALAERLDRDIASLGRMMSAMSVLATVVDDFATAPEVAPGTEIAITRWRARRK